MTSEKQTNRRPNEGLEVTYRNGVVAHVAKPGTEKRSLRSWVGVMEGAYGSTAQEVNAYIRRERESWEKWQPTSQR